MKERTNTQTTTERASKIAEQMIRRLLKAPFILRNADI